MLWMIHVILILVCDFCTSQEFNNGCNGTEDCKAVTNCIGDYNDLEAYIMNNSKIVEELAQTFFITRQAVSKFVTITYNFQTTNKGIQLVEHGIANCTRQQSTYVWSETAFYLLGPKALYWFTLFAICIDEVDITVKLPCLCNDVYSSLLSRLTYLIKVYAATKYHDHPLQFVNKCYFQVKNSNMNDEGYNTVIIIMIFITILPLTSMFGVSPLAVLHVYPIVLRRINIKEVEANLSEYLDSGIVPIKVKTENHYKKPLHMKPLTLTSVSICIGFLIFHVFSVVRFIQYGNKVLSSEDYQRIIPIAHAVLSLFAVATGFVLTVICLKVRISKQQEQQQDGNAALQSLLIPAAVISMNFIYIGCYFMPYMLLAFIHDPLLTTFTYLTLALFIVCIYLVCLGVCNLYKFKCKKYDDNIKVAKFFDKLLYSCMVWAIAFSLTMFLFVVTCIIILGSFNDLRDMKYLIQLPLAVVSVVLLKPVYAHLSNKNEDASDKKEQGCVQGKENSDNI